MVGFSNADNKFGPSPFIVGTTLGDGCNYTSIQSAINDASALAISSGFSQTILIRMGIYNENLTLIQGVNLKAWNTTGLLENTCQINGLFTFNANGGGIAVVVIDGISLFNGTNSVTVLDITTDSTTIGGVFLQNTGVRAPGAGAKAIVCTPDPAAFSLVFGVDSTIDGAGVGIECHNTAALQMQGTTITSSGGAAVSESNTSQLLMDDCTFGGTSAAIIANDTSAMDLSFCTLTASGGPAIQTTSAGVSVSTKHCTMSSNDVSTFFITGQATYSYSGVINTGTAINLDPALSLLAYDFKPYGTAGASPGTGVQKGTSCFDSTQFSVSNGFVNVKSNASIAYTEQSTSFLAAAGNGYFVQGTTTVSLPSLTAADDGAVIEISVESASVVTLQCPLGQSINIGNTSSATGGTATSTDQGNVLILRYRDSTTSFRATSVVGNWVLA